MQQEGKRSRAEVRSWIQATLLFLNALVTIPLNSFLIYTFLFSICVCYSLFKTFSNEKDGSTLLLLLFQNNAWWIIYLLYSISDPLKWTTRGGGLNLPPAWHRWCRDYSGYQRLGRYFDTQLIADDRWTSVSPSSVDKNHKHENPQSPRDHNDNDKHTLNDASNPSPPYLFCYHPHGLISVGANIALNTNGCRFDNDDENHLFLQHEAITSRCGVTLNVTLLAPFFREWLLCLGFCSANKQTLISTMAGGKSLVLIPGGAAEALHASPGQMTLHLKHRKGFIRLALQTGTPIVPCLGFGENEIYPTLYCGDNGSQLGQGRQQKQSGNDTGANDSKNQTFSSSTLHYKNWIWNFQQIWTRLFSFSLPIPTSLFPRAVKLTIVMGKPIVFDPNDSVNKCHEVYLQRLEALYDKYKEELGYQDIPLRFV